MSLEEDDRTLRSMEDWPAGRMTSSLERVSPSAGRSRRGAVLLGDSAIIEVFVLLAASAGAGAGAGAYESGRLCDIENLSPSLLEEAKLELCRAGLFLVIDDDGVAGSSFLFLLDSTVPSLSLIHISEPTRPY